MALHTAGYEPWSGHGRVDTMCVVGRARREQRGGAMGRAGTEDRELVARLMARDERALSEIYRRHAGLVLGLARRLLADDSLAEDVTQEVFLSLWQHPDHFDPARGSLRAWLGLLAHRRSVDRVRTEVRRANTEQRRDPCEPTMASPAEVDDKLSLVWLAVRVNDALEQLPAEQREAVVLAYYGGRTYRQVAAELDIPEGTAKSRLRLALSRLDQLLRPTLTDQGAPVWT